MDQAVSWFVRLNNIEKLIINSSQILFDFLGHKIRVRLFSQWTL